MFDLENDDKKKLKENMEQIKDLINQGGDAQGQKPSPEPEEPPEPEQGFPEQDSFDTDTGNQDFSPDDEFEAQDTGQETFDEAGFDTSTEPGTENEFESSEAEEIDNAIDQIEEGLEEFEEENVPSGEAIFLTVERFEGLKNRITEMRHLSKDIEDMVDHFQGGLEEDRNTADEAQKLLEDFSRRRAEVEDIVLSHE